MKECSTCQLVKPFDSFYKNKENRDGYRKDCKVCKKLRVRIWQLENPDKYREQKMCSRYKLSKNQYKKAIEIDHCEICLNNFTKLVFDHCHKTGKVRGMICDSCNKALGFLKDDEENLIRALNYLEINNEEV